MRRTSWSNCSRVIDDPRCLLDEAVRRPAADVQAAGQRGQFRLLLRKADRHAATSSALLLGNDITLSISLPRRRRLAAEQGGGAIGVGVLAVQRRDARLLPPGVGLGRLAFYVECQVDRQGVPRFLQEGLYCGVLKDILRAARRGQHLEP